MIIPTNFQNLYKPIQPTVKPSSDVGCYEEILPAPALSNLICCYWRLQTLEPLTAPFYYRVVADGCMDIYFDRNNPEDSFVMGFCKQYTEFPLYDTFDYIGIRFFPSIFPQLFKIAASELSNRFEKLDAVIPRTASFIADYCSPQQSLDQIIQTLDLYFLNLMHSNFMDNDPRFYNALNIILDKQGIIQVEKDLDTGLSTRQLRRHFDYYIGDSAKTFSKVVRFQNILREAGQSPSIPPRSAETGYYDQAHFIKEFKTLYGSTPGKIYER